MTATQRVQVVERHDDVVQLRIVVIHPDEGDVVPDRAMALQWLVASVPHDTWRLSPTSEGSSPSEGGALAKLLREARVETFAHLVWWLNESERRVVSVEVLERRNEDATRFDLSQPDALPQLLVQVRVGAASLVAHLTPGDEWECAPFPPGLVAFEAPRRLVPKGSRRERLGLREILEGAVGPTLALDWLVHSADNAERLAEWPGLGQIEDLRVGFPLGPDGARVLAASAHAHAVHRLRLESAEVGDAGLEVLARSPAWPALRALRISGEMLPNATRALRGTPLYARLEELELRGLGLDEAGALALLDDPPPMLSALALTANGLFSPEVVQRIAALPHLSSLDLAGEDYDEHALMPLFTAAPGLSRLVLTGTAIGDAGLTALAASPHWPHLVELDLSNTLVEDASLSNLAGGPVASRLRTLRLYNLPLAAATVTRLVEAGVFPRLRQLTLGENGFDREDLKLPPGELSVRFEG